MTFDLLVGFVADHWVILGLILCPIVIVLMALAALTCEACGAPFGIFRRRSRTIDLCLRCALIHDIRHAGEGRAADADASSAQASVPPSGEESSREDRRYSSTKAASLGAVGHAGTR
jgi:hypothetical protein